MAAVLHQARRVSPSPAAPAAALLLVLAACVPGAGPGAPATPLRSAPVWVVTGADSTALTVEVARTTAQAEAGCWR